MRTRLGSALSWKPTSSMSDLCSHVSVRTRDRRCWNPPIYNRTRCFGHCLIYWNSNQPSEAPISFAFRWPSLGWSKVYVVRNMTAMVIIIKRQWEVSKRCPVHLPTRIHLLLMEWQCLGGWLASEEDFCLCESCIRWFFEFIEFHDMLSMLSWRSHCPSLDKFLMPHQRKRRNLGGIGWFSLRLQCLWSNFLATSSRKFFTTSIAWVTSCLGMFGALGWE